MKENGKTFFQSRSCGILLHPTSLPGPSGIGTFGKEAFEFIDKLAESGIQYWQILPLTPVGVGNSPYQSWSAFAGNHLLINKEILMEEGFIHQDYNGDRKPEPESSFVADFELAEQTSGIFLREAYQTFQQKQLMFDQFQEFCNSESYWLDDFALYAAIRKKLNYLPLQQWPEEIKHKDPEALSQMLLNLDKVIDFERFVQFTFYRQWKLLKKYANERNIQIIGDLPIYVSADSAEVWHNPGLFELDNDLNPSFVAGVPPDYFSETGQLWGNPIYKWSAHEQSDFEWWHRRIEFTLNIFDAVRIDHFRGFADFWSIPAGEETAEKGTWNSAPGMKLFESLRQKHYALPVIAEDLGILSEEAICLREHFGFPGMKVLQFAFTNTAENSFLPHFYEKNFVVYTGTHDNNTCKGWFNEDAHTDEKEAVIEYLQCSRDEVVDSMLRLAWSSVANTVIVPVQDLFALDSDARMNTPGTLTGNWQWRMTGNQLRNFPVEKIKKLNRIFARTR